MSVALCGGGAFGSGLEIDAELIELSGCREVVLLSAAAAFEDPDRVVRLVAERCDVLGVTLRALPVATRADARDSSVADSLHDCRLLMISGGSPMHLRSILKDTALWTEIVEVHRRGGLVVADAEAATVVTDPMSDPRGGAFTLGLDMVSPLAVLARHESWSPERSRRTRELAPAGICVANLDSGSCLVGDAGGWRQIGHVPASIYLDGRLVGLERLPPLS